MAKGTTRPNIPIFVSSTFTDMQSYRRKVRDALSQLETVVRGMEQFGSKPGSPVAECLKVVQSCRLYIGVFGMRYGSVPDDFDKSMTHLEYEEAQRLSLPSLVYILDKNHPIPPKNVETGVGAEKLQTLKEKIKKKYLVIFFTTPEDLQARITHDVPAVLEQLGVEVIGDLTKIDETNDTEVLKKFELLPKLFSGRQVTIEFTMASARSAFNEDCSALNLEQGATVTANAALSSGQTFYLYGEREIALRMLAIPKGSVVKARVNTAFGVTKQVIFTDDEPVLERRSEIGLVITELLNIATSKF